VRASVAGPACRIRHPRTALSRRANVTCYGTGPAQPAHRGDAQGKTRWDPMRHGTCRHTVAMPDPLMFGPSPVALELAINRCPKYSRSPSFLPARAGLTV